MKPLLQNKDTEGKYNKFKKGDLVVCVHTQQFEGFTLYTGVEEDLTEGNLYWVLDVDRNQIKVNIKSNNTNNNGFFNYVRFEKCPISEIL